MKKPPIIHEICHDERLAHWSTKAQADSSTEIQRINDPGLPLMRKLRAAEKLMGIVKLNVNLKRGHAFTRYSPALVIGGYIAISNLALREKDNPHLEKLKETLSPYYLKAYALSGLGRAPD